MVDVNLMTVRIFQVSWDKSLEKKLQNVSKTTVCNLNRETGSLVTSDDIIVGYKIHHFRNILLLTKQS